MIPLLSPLTLIPLFAFTAGPTDEDTPPLTAAARIDADELVVGDTYEIGLVLELAEGVDSAGAGMPAMLLQLDVPEGVTLEGPVLDTMKKQQRNEFLYAPFERLIRVGDSTVGFTLTGPPEDGATIGLNLVGYLQSEERGSFFVRHRLELAVAAGAESAAGDSTVSDWGVEEDLLQIGDTAPAFTLPRADGTTVELASYRGSKNVVVTTYRAFW